MKPMLATERAILHQFHPAGVITAVFHSCIIPVLALCTSQSNHRAHIFLRSHIDLPVLQRLLRRCISFTPKSL
jgi:hypothetical protein